jgi:hypothetical protein
MATNKREPTPKKDRIPGRYRTYQLFGHEVLEKSDRAFPGLRHTFPEDIRRDPTPEAVTGHLVREISSRYERALLEQSLDQVDWDSVYGLAPGTCASLRKRLRKLPLHNAIVGYARGLGVTCGDANEA